MRRQITILLIATHLIVVSTAGLAAAEGAGAEADARIAQSAGLTPDSRWYWLDRALEQLQLLLTRGDEQRAVVLAGLAVERASESAVVAKRGRTELAERSAGEAERILAESVGHLQKAMEESEDELAAEAIVMDAGKQSRAILEQVLAKAPAEAKTGLTRALERQEQGLAALQEYGQARKSYLDARQELDEAKSALAAARRGSDPAAVLEAEARLRALEARQSELERLQDRAEQARERARKAGPPEQTDETGGAKAVGRSDAEQPGNPAKANPGRGSAKKP